MADRTNSVAENIGIIREESALLADWAEDTAPMNSVEADEVRARLLSAADALAERTNELERTLADAEDHLGDLVSFGEATAGARHAEEKLEQARREADQLREALTEAHLLVADVVRAPDFDIGRMEWEARAELALADSQAGEEGGWWLSLKSACRIASNGLTGEIIDLDGLDPGIARYVEILWTAGIDTYESCEGGEGHSYPEPAIRFRGDRTEGFKALHIAAQHGLPVSTLRRFWSVDRSGEPTGPYWELSFVRPDECIPCIEVDSPDPTHDADA